MGAICGVLGTDGRPFVAADLAPVLDALRPLGPDGHGVWDGRAGRVGVALGVREQHLPGRCEGAGRPVRAADGSVCLVADAELDCRDDLLSVLRVPRGDRASDAELVLAAYERWGPACLEHLGGGLAVAVADARRGGVLLARDALGGRPLVVHERRGVVAFASTALALCALEGIGHDLDRERVAEWLALVTQTERTFVRGVTVLPAGHCAWIDDRGQRRRRWWSVDPGRYVERGSAEAHAADLRAALDAAVQRRMPAGAPVGVLLSGGLDSTSVAATAARLRPGGEVRTYTSAPPVGWRGTGSCGVDADETALVEELAARHPSLRPAYVRGDHGPLLALHDARFAAGSPPPRNPCNELWIAAATRRAAADGVHVLLTGARGNGFFSGDDPFWLAELLARGRIGAVRDELAALAARRGAPVARVAAREAALQLLPPGVHRARLALRRRRERPPGPGLRHFAGPGTVAAVRAHARTFGPVGRGEVRPRWLRVLSHTGGQAEAAAVRDALLGVRRPDPTSDVRLIELCLTQPPWVRRRGGRTRVVCRDAMADRLPPSIGERTGRGAQLPDWLDRLTERRGELEDELAAAREHALCRELLDLDGMGAALAAWPDPARAGTSMPHLVQVYRSDLFRALLMARYLRFFEAHGAAARQASSARR